MAMKSGKKNPNEILTEDDVHLIRQVYELGGISYAKLAEKFECGESTIRDIIKNKTWKKALINIACEDLKNQQ